MRRFFVGLFALIGMFTFIIVLALILSLYRFNSPAMPFVSPDDSLVLSLTLGDQILEEKSSDGGLITFIKGRPMSVYTVISGIHQAAQDKNVKGILLNVEGNSLKMATSQEIREALKAFKATGKFIYTYADTFGELSNGTGLYYLAAVTSKIWVMPLGEFNFNGMIVEIPFAKKALDNFKIRPQLGRREEFKGMVESIVESDFTAPYRENMQRLLDKLTTQIVNDVAVDRGLEATAVRNILDASPHTLEDALAAKMIDEIGYKDEIKGAIEKLLGKKPIYYNFEDYVHAQQNLSKGEKIAIIYAEGTITKGKVAHNPLSDDTIMDALEVAKNIREAGDDKNIKAIVLRIDSGGGYPIASELIGREVERLKSKKPVIVSMANYAASGGYWIACNARKIVAHPATLTGSIGVYAGKIVTQEFWDNYGIHWGEIHAGNNAAVWSRGQEFSEVGRQKLNGYLDKIYTTFQEKVAKGRNLPQEKVHQIAKGQVWTGAEAKENGLIDELGGLMTAIEIAKKEAGIAPEESVTLQHLPLPKSILDFVFDRNQNNEPEILARYPIIRMILKHLGGVMTPARVEVKLDTASHSVE